VAIGVPAAGLSTVLFNNQSPPFDVQPLPLPGSTKVFTRGIPWVTVAMLAQQGWTVVNAQFTTKTLHVGSPVVLTGAQISFGTYLGTALTPVPNPSLFIG